MNQISILIHDQSFCFIAK